MCGIVTSLLSKVGVKGLIIGFAFAISYSVLFVPTEDKVYEQVGVDAAIMKDYKDFLKRTGREEENPKNEVIESEIYRIQNTPILVFFRELAFRILNTTNFAKSTK